MNQPPSNGCNGPEARLFQKRCDYCKQWTSKSAKKTVQYCAKKPGQKPPILYSWGKRSPEGKLHWLLNQTDSAQRTADFRELLAQEDASANRRGPGLYLCNTITGSAEYCPKLWTDECVLIRVVVGGIVPCLDITTAPEKAAFEKKYGKQIDHDFGLAPVLIHFTDYETGHWYVLKAHCSFSVFDGTGFEVTEVEYALELFNKKMYSGAYCTLMRQLAPAIRNKLAP